LHDSEEPSIVKIKTEYGRQVARTMLLMQIGKMIEILDADFSKVQVKFIADLFENDYYAYKLSDLQAITKRIATSKGYGKPTIQTVCEAIEKYSYERDEAAVGLRSKENSQHKDSPVTNEKVNEIYEKLKRKAKEPSPSQKEKDAKNKSKNNEKMKEILKLYPERKWVKPQKKVQKPE
jgi:hypothetical protein